MTTISFRGNKSTLFSVVIASLCEEARGDLLARACNSIQAMAGGLDYSIIVVANGPKVSGDVLRWLDSQPDISVARLKSGSHPLARRVGAEIANSEFLAFLDDDDELIPDTLSLKVAEFRTNPEIDVLVSDGFRITGSREEKIFPGPEARGIDFVTTMMSAGWGAGALTLRADNIDLGVFDTELRHMEWTYTALKLARHHCVGFLDVPTYRYYEDTPNSLSKLAEHSFAAQEVWQRLCEIYADTPYCDVVRRRYGRVCHDVSSTHASQGNIGQAWRVHLDSLQNPGGSKYLTYSARLVLESLKHLRHNHLRDD